MMTQAAKIPPRVLAFGLLVERELLDRFLASGLPPSQRPSGLQL